MSSEEPQKKKKSLSLPKKPQKDRFAAPTSSDELKKECEGYVPITTQRCTTWAVRVFENWKSERAKNSEENCPDDLFETGSLPALNKWLSAFVIEARREDGGRYPATTITNLLSGLWRYARSKSPS